MTLPQFHYHEPDSLADACRMLSKFGENGALLAGGTDLLVKMKNRELRPDHIICLAELEEITAISHTGAQCVIGAGCKVAHLAESVFVRTAFPALSSGAEQLGSPTVRNMGTIGGNIMTASPAADLPPALMAYGASVRLKSQAQDRILPLEHFFTGPGATCIKKGEILADIRIAMPPAYSGTGFFKLGNRKALQISIINGACYLALDGGTGTIKTARIVLGAVAPTPVRAHTAEALLLGQTPSAGLFETAGHAAARDCKPINDLRGSAAYRKDMVAVLTKRTLESALVRIHGSSKEN